MWVAMTTGARPKWRFRSITVRGSNRKHVHPDADSTYRCGFHRYRDVHIGAGAIDSPYQKIAADLRVTAARRGKDTKVDRLIADLLAASDEFGRYWEEMTVEPLRSTRKMLVL